jgi:hypothetical protein
MVTSRQTVRPADQAHRCEPLTEVKLSAMPESSLDNGENGDQALGLEEMLWLCDFCVTGMEGPFRIYLVVHLGPSCRQFPNQLPV